MLWFGTLLFTGMLVFTAKSEVVPDGVQLRCSASLLPDSTVRFQVPPPLTSRQSDSSWHLKDGTKIAHFPDSNTTLVKDLTNSSITMYHCMDLHFSRTEWNETSKLRMSWAVCEVNCPALMMQLSLASHANSTNSTEPPPPMGSPRLHPTTLAICAVVLAALLLGFGVKYFKTWYTNRKKENSKTNDMSADEKVNLPSVRCDEHMC